MPRNNRRTTAEEANDLVPEGSSSHVRNREGLVRNGLQILDPKNTTEPQMIERFEQQRTKYAPMRAHREMAAMILATGGTYKQAAAKAGVSPRQVRKYMTSPDFRTRIEELRQTMLSGVRGRLLKELERRTDGKRIKQIELLDLLRIFDRVNGPVGGKNGVNIQGDVNVNNYDTLVQALLTAQPGTQSTDFPAFELEGSAISSEDSPF